MIRKNKVIYFLLSTLFGLQNTYSYTHNLTNEGTKIKWESAKQTIVINPQSSNGSLNSSTAQAIILQSLSQWNQTSSAVQLSGVVDGSSTPRQRVNNLYFSSSHSSLGPSVAGVTVTVSDISSGELLESDIIINDSLNISPNIGSNLYLGDIVTHELGHFLGLAHSQVQFSSMFYRLNKSQNKISSDDRAGARSLYQPNTDATIKGKIIGGQARTGIFGAHVQAISLKDGEVKASAISQPSGAFEIQGLPTSDEYYLYIDKLDALETLPTFYREVKSNFCQSGSSYRGSFFQSCFSRDVGFPQVLKMNSASTLDVGEITVRCGLDVPLEYFSQKPSNGARVDMDIEVQRRVSGVSHVGEALVGFFSADEIENNQEDLFRFELTNEFISQLNSQKEYYLEIKTVSQSLYSQLRLETRVEREDGLQAASPFWDQISQDSRLKPKLDTSIRIRIDAFDSSNNSFQLQVTPYSIADVVSSTIYSEEALFPDVVRFSDQLGFYLLNLSVVERLSAGVYVPISSKPVVSLTDNKLCPDAPLSYGVDSTRISSSMDSGSRRGLASSKDGAQDPLSLGCGTIDLGGPSGPGGPTILLLSVLAMLILSRELKIASRA